MRFLDAGGLFAMLDVLEVAPLLLKRQIIGCLADLMQYRKAAKLCMQWNSQVTMKGALKILLELWQSEQEAAGSMAPDGVIRDLERPLNPQSGDGDRDKSMRADSRQTDSSLRSSHASVKLRHARSFADANNKVAANSSKRMSGVDATMAAAANVNASAALVAGAPASFGAGVADRQDCRAKIYAILQKVGFESQEALGIAERQQMELVKLYPDAMQLETWVEVYESLRARGIKPISADRKWIEDSILENTDKASRVQGVQRRLADERHSEEQASLQRYYEDIRGRAQLRRVASAQRSSATTPGENGYPTGGPSSGEDS